MGQFEGKVVLVTGGTSGLGKATAAAFAQQGAKVVIAGRREELGRDVEASIRASQGEATFVRCDVAHEDQVRALVDRTVQLHGRLDYAYNNAAAAPDEDAKPLAEVSVAAYDAMMNVSLRAVFLCMKYEIPAMIAGGGGAIVNCSSTAAHSAIPGLGVYGAAKAGVETLTRFAAREYASANIRVNAICVGSVETPMSALAGARLPPAVVEAVVAKMALGRAGQPPEVAAAVLFLCSEGASYITGANLAIDGGYLLT